MTTPDPVVPPRDAASQELEELVGHAEEATRAYMCGDVDRYFTLTRHAVGYTLMNPFGGPAVRYDDRSESLRSSSGFIRNGEAQLDEVHTHAWGDTVVLVTIERQHAEVGGLPDQDWSLRVTQGYRRADDGWQLVHRHADPLVHAVDLAQAAALARGSRTPSSDEAS